LDAPIGSAIGPCIRRRIEAGFRQHVRAYVQDVYELGGPAG